MKTTLKHLTILFLVGIIITCGNSTNTQMAKSKIQQANWIIGQWQNNSAEGNLTETWVQQNDSIIEGKTFFVIGSDTVFSEVTKLEQRGEDLLYIPTIKNQNDGQPVILSLLQPMLHNLYSKTQHMIIRKK